MLSRRSLIASGAALLAGGCVAKKSLSKVSLRLLWYPQTQFAGYLVAKAKGYYQAEGLDVEIRPAGPDLKPTATVAAGTDDFGIGVSNEIITARSNGVPLKIVSQVFQDSANRYVLKGPNRIQTLSDLKGKNIGLWLGSDEAEFIAMLATAGMKPTDLKIIPQEYSITPFLRDQFVLSQVTIYNELLQLADAGYPAEKLQILSPKDYGCAIASDMVFTSERTIEERPEVVKAFVSASIKGWQDSFTDMKGAVAIAKSLNPELDPSQQLRQLEAVKTLVLARGKNAPIGFPSVDTYNTAQNVLLKSGQITKLVDASSVYSLIAYK